jgi:NAD(P)-dependent dehydrogenase (short-subunit alcohol dehydrogenase family)
VVCRASKTALNQLTKCMSLEFARRKQNVACVLLHPGTCDTVLSAPFQKNVPDGKLFSRERGARQLLEIVDSMTMSRTGSFVAWDKSPIPW